MDFFGFQLKDKAKGKNSNIDSLVSPIAPVPDDGSAVIDAAGNYGIALDIEGSVRDDSELIKRYREVATYPDCNSAIEDIINEAIAAQDDEESVSINLDEIKELSSGIKDKIIEEFDNVKMLLDFEAKGHDIFKRWYVDGRIFYQKMIDEKQPKEGIKELRYIDPRKIRKVKEVKKELSSQGVQVIQDVQEYYVYMNSYLTANNTVGVNTSQAFNSKGIKLPVDSVVYATSGLVDLDKNVVLSYLNEAIKPVNSLRMMEDAIVIYRMSRAPERRIFYIDTGKMSPAKAEEYVKKVMSKYKNKVVYDATTGEVRDDRKYLNMLEDFWMPRPEGSTGTQIDTLPGAENLGQIQDVEYMQKKLFQSLHVPLSRLMPDQAQALFGSSNTVSRDELKFSKFVARLRKRFSVLFLDLLRTQLSLKNIMSVEDFDTFKNKILFDFNQDEYFAEMKESEILKNRFQTLAMVAPYIGTLVDQEYALKKILRLKDEEIKEIQKNNKKNPYFPQDALVQQEMMQNQARSAPASAPSQETKA